MPDLILAPYLVLKTPVTVGTWELVPFCELHQDDDESEAELRGWVPDALRGPVMRLVEAYGVEAGGTTLGAVVSRREGVPVILSIAASCGASGTPSSRGRSPITRK